MFLLFKMKFSFIIVLVFVLYFTYRWQGRLHLLSEIFLLYFFLRMTTLRKPESHCCHRCPPPICRWKGY